MGNCPGSCKDIDCYGGVTSDECFRMARNNCKTSPRACVICPCTYAMYGANHCLICCSRRMCKCGNGKQLTQREAEIDHQMYTIDEMCHDNHCKGCICCPLYIPVIPLGFAGMFFTWVGSSVCFIAGGCLSCLEKLDKCSSIRKAEPDYREGADARGSEDPDMVYMNRQ